MQNKQNKKGVSNRIHGAYLPAA